MGMPKGTVQHKYTAEEHQFILDHTEGITSVELAELFYGRYGVRISARAFNSYRKRHGLKCGVNCQFKKGAAPINKGKKQTEFMTADGIKRSSVTRFKKGQVSINHRPVGSERINVDGYCEIKVAEPNKWKLRGRAVYEVEYGPISKGHKLVHINGNSVDDRLENLVVLTNSEMARLNQSKLMCKGDTESNQVAINVAKLADKIGRLKKGKKYENNSERLE